MLRVLIADDDARIREALQRIISQASDMTVVAEAINGQDALNKIGSVESDVILLDISMPDINELEVLRLEKRDRPDLCILVVSVHPAEVYAERAVRADAAGYLTKNRAAEHLVGAIRKVFSGSQYLSAPLPQEVRLHQLSNSQYAPPDTFSEKNDSDS